MLLVNLRDDCLVRTCLLASLIDSLRDVGLVGPHHQITEFVGALLLSIFNLIGFSFPSSSPRTCPLGRPLHLSLNEVAIFIIFYMEHVLEEHFAVFTKYNTRA